MPLHAVQHPGAAVPAGGRRDRVDVGAGAFLGDRVALLALAADRGQQVALELVGGGHRREPGRRRGGDPAEGVGHPADLLLDEDLLERGAATAAERARQVRREEAELDRALLVRGGDVAGRPPDSSASTSNGMSSSAKARARAWMSSSAADRPYMNAGTSPARERLREETLTEHSV